MKLIEWSIVEVDRESEMSTNDTTRDNNVSVQGMALRAKGKPWNT